PAERQMGLPIVQPPQATAATRWRFSFDDFVVGPSNELAWAASTSLCRDTLTSDHLFLSAGPGLGKTHLLQAIGQNLSSRSNRRAPAIACLTAEEFATRLVLAIKAREVGRFKAEFREAVDVLLLEDIHFFQGKEKMQDELLCTLKALQARGCKVVCTSSFLPRELDGLGSSLVSQFTAGYLAEIQKPDFETRRRIVERKAK
ncbi:MAG TPA: chromosomal replication initiator protein DnaA, partial [Desulfovibrio sp.]|nr:chromosomal replication initiator protein DnaA [Desulfovibrio sp.]